jgi:glyoxylase-like metal-dependent hydrolase (beta-lactamase superfamily II)
VDGVRALEDGDRLSFARFSATVLLTPGHTAGLTCLVVEEDGLLFSSDHLVHPVGLDVALRGGDLPPPELPEAYRRSLARVYALDVRVVLPGRGAPFAGHRRVVREVLSSMGGAEGSDVRRRFEPGSAGVARGAWREPSDDAHDVQVEDSPSDGNAG